MKTIKVFYTNEPVLEVRFDESQKANFGLHRDRNPDAGWGEYRWGRIDERVKEVELTPELKQILIEDICSYYKGTEAFNKLKEFDLIKD